MSILVFNAGSSSLKLGLFDDEAKSPLASGSIDWAAGRENAKVTLRRGDGAEVHSETKIADNTAAAKQALAILQEAKLLSPFYRDIIAVGHRVVHGGAQFHNAVIIDDSVRKVIGELARLAPLHNPAALDGIVAAQAALPHVRHVAAFDTAFFAKLPPRAYLYPVPYEWFTEWGIRRFGFHGISHQYCAGRASELLGRRDARLVICHLGHGCSATAVRNEGPIMTTMGFTPLEGLMMGSRSGSIDPGILPWIQREHAITPEKLDQILNRQSGLLGVSGLSPDYRTVHAAALAGNARAVLALQMYADRIRATIGALAASLGGLDALVFTAGVGEHGPAMREQVCAGLEFLGLMLDGTNNKNSTGDDDISANNARVRVLVIHTREELMIARAALELLGT